MSKQMYLEFLLKPEHADDFANLCNSSEGFTITKKQLGFISADWMISTSEDGSTCFHLWEKWESAEHFDAYMQTPERAPGSKFNSLLTNWAAGETKIYWGDSNLV